MQFFGADFTTSARLGILARGPGFGLGRVRDPGWEVRQPATPWAVAYLLNTSGMPYKRRYTTLTGSPATR